MHGGNGWWDWFDQTQYLHITQQLASADLSIPKNIIPHFIQPFHQSQAMRLEAQSHISLPILRFT